jgi:hypothetical protein
MPCARSIDGSRRGRTHAGRDERDLGTDRARIDVAGSAAGGADTADARGGRRGEADGTQADRQPAQEGDDAKEDDRAQDERAKDDDAKEDDRAQADRAQEDRAALHGPEGRGPQDDGAEDRRAQDDPATIEQKEVAASAGEAARRCRAASFSFC